MRRGSQIQSTVGNNAENHGRFACNVLLKHAFDIIPRHIQVALNFLTDTRRAAGVGLERGQGGDLATDTLQTEHAVGLILRLEFLQVVCADLASGKFIHALAHRSFHFLEGFAGSWVLDDDEHHLAGQFAATVADVGLHRAAGLYQALV